jgi:hypothetical protein
LKRWVKTPEQKEQKALHARIPRHTKPTFEFQHRDSRLEQDDRSVVEEQVPNPQQDSHVDDGREERQKPVKRDET